jgi:hypothetical protein
LFQAPINLSFILFPNRHIVVFLYFTLSKNLYQIIQPKNNQDLISESHLFDIVLVFRYSQDDLVLGSNQVLAFTLAESLLVIHFHISSIKNTASKIAVSSQTHGIDFSFSNFSVYQSSSMMSLIFTYISFIILSLSFIAFL